MRENFNEPSFELQSWFDGSDIFYRIKDRARLNAAVAAIVDDGHSVAVIGSNEAVLDHYCRMMTARLREHEGFELELFLPVNTDSLLSRYNEMLAEITLEQATKPARKDMPVRLLVINDARSVNPEQWSLLARLLADFPGVNVRLILFLNKSGWPAHEKLLNTLGRRMYRWVVEVPAMDEARQLLEAAQENGYEQEAEKLLIAAGLGGVISGRYRLDNTPSETDPDLPDLPELDIDVLIGEQNTHLKEKGQPRKSRFFPIVMVFGICIAASIFVISWLHPSLLDEVQQAVFDSDQSLLQNYRVESVSIPTEQEINARAALAEVAESVDADENTLPDEGDTPPNNGEQAIESPAPPVEQEAVPEPSQVVTAILAAEQTASSDVDEQPAAGSETPAETPVATPARDAADELSAESNEVTAEPVVASVDAPVESLPQAPLAASRLATAEIVANASPTEYFVQHIVLRTEAAAGEYIDRYDALKNARIVPVRVSQNTAYAVISGPFTSRFAAATFTQDQTIPRDYWIRGSQQLKAILQR